MRNDAPPQPCLPGAWSSRKISPGFPTMSNPYALSLLLPGVTGLGLCLLGLRRRDAPGGLPFALLTAALAVYSLGYAGELTHRDLESVLAWNRLEYVGVAAIPGCWALFCLDYVRGGRGIPAWAAAALFAIPAATLVLVLTMGLGHELYYQNPRISHAGSFPTLVFERGPGYWVYILYLNLCLLAGVTLLGRFWWRAAGPYRRQTAAITLAALAPWAAHLVYLAGLTPANLDIVPFALGVTCLVTGWALFRTRLLDLAPVAHALLLEAMQDGVLVLGPRGRVVEMNPAAKRLAGGIVAPVGLTPAEALARLPGLAARLESLPQGTDTVLVALQDREMWLDVRIQPVCDRKGHPLGRLVVLRDITRHKQTMDRLREMSRRDALTGLHNQGFFMAELTRLEREAEGPVTVLAADLDRLKEVNDAAGHAAGDELLRRAARAFAGAFRAGDVAARTGGDEFAALLPGCDEAAAAEALARVQRNIEQENAAPGPRLSLSLGAATARPGQSLQAALEAADQDMYRHKRTRRA